MGLDRRQLGDDETVVLLVRPHALALWRPALVLLLLSPAVGVVVALAPAGEARRWLLGAAGLAAGWVAFRYVVWPFLVWWHTVYAVTDHRVLVRRGVISRTGRDLPLSQVVDVSFSRDLGDRVLGAGRLVVQPGGGAEALVLESVPQVVQVASTMSMLVDRTELDDAYADQSTDDEGWDDEGWDDESTDDEGWDDGVTPARLELGR